MADIDLSDILQIIEKLVFSGRNVLDEILVKRLKKICKLSDQYVCYAYHALMTNLKKKHSEIRYSALLIINELFCRSACFRKLLEADLDEFLELVAATHPEKPLPLPVSAAKLLKVKSMEFMQAWASKFGAKYVRFELALSYLKNCIKVDFSDMEARSAVQRQQHQVEQERLERIQSEKISKVKTEMQDVVCEISSTLTQMENCFRLLVPHPGDLFSTEDFNSLENEKNSCDHSSVDESYSTELHNSLRQHGVLNMEKSITIQVIKDPSISINVNEDTQPIIENLNDLHKQMKIRYLPIITNWLKVLTKGNNCFDTLKTVIDLKQLVEAAFQKYKDLKINSYLPEQCDDNDEEDDFVEVNEKEGYEAVVKKQPIFAFDPSLPGCSKQAPVTEEKFSWKLKHSLYDVSDPTTAASTLNKIVANHILDEPTPNVEIRKSPSNIGGSQQSPEGKKAKLLSSAPVLPYDIDLYHWEEEKLIIPERVKFDSLHKFWESKNDDDENDVLKQAQIASLRTRKIDFSGKFEPVKFACRAPLQNGQLCPRRDRFKCPFHGRIVKRDSSGKPVNPEDVTKSLSASTSAVPEWQDPQLLRDIKAATGIDLKIPEKGKRKKKAGGLTNIKKIQSSSRDRLTKKILKRYKHYARKLDDMERKKFNDKFGDQWNYY